VIAVAEHGHHAGPVHALRVVQRGVGEAVGLELLHSLVPERDHRVLGAELQAAGRARLDAGRLQPDLHPIHAQRALGHLACCAAEVRHTERAAGLAQAAADARVRVDVDDAVLVLHDRAGRRARVQAAGISAVHALVLAHEPGEAAAVQLLLAELDEVPERVQAGHGLVGAGQLGLQPG
jgi:hypothetical protein